MAQTNEGKMKNEIGTKYYAFVNLSSSYRPRSNTPKTSKYTPLPCPGSFGIDCTSTPATKYLQGIYKCKYRIYAIYYEYQLLLFSFLELL
jgi:hypothetical protein